MKRTNILIIAIIGLFAVLVMILTLSNDDQKKGNLRRGPIQQKMWTTTIHRKG